MKSGFVVDQRQNVTKFDPRGDKSCGVADFDAPSPAASPPREPQPAVEEPRSAPEVDAASAGGAVPKTSGCAACDLGICTRHVRLPLGVTLDVDPPPEKASPKSSGEKPADETHRAAASSSASMPPSTAAPSSDFFWILLGRLTCGDKPARLPSRPGTRPQRGRATSGTRRENIGSAAEWNN